jgi:carbon monoxide dehydrogenase subunit G
MAEVMVELSEPIGSDVTVAWHTTPGTAGTEDFTPRHGRVVIPAGQTTAMIHAEVTADSIDEPTERFTVDVDDAIGTTIMDGSATVKIRDDDAPPRVSIDDGGGVESSGGAWAAVHLSAPSGRTVVVKYVTHHDTARSGSDYVRTKGELVFAPGETTKYVGVRLVDDHVRERTERFTVELYETDNAGVARSVGTMTIHDDD